MGDGAEWIWNLADLHFPGAVQIVDLYHARQHLWDLLRSLHPNHPVNQQVWMKVHQKQLLIKARSRSWFSRSAPSNQATPTFWKKFASRRTTLSEMPSVCATQVPSSASVRRFWCDRSRLPDRNRFPPKAIRNLLDRARRQYNSRPPMLSTQCPFRGLLGEPSGGLTSTSMSRTLLAWGFWGCIKARPRPCSGILCFRSAETAGWWDRRFRFRLPIGAGLGPARHDHPGDSS